MYKRLALCFCLCWLICWGYTQFLAHKASDTTQPPETTAAPTQSQTTQATFPKDPTPVEIDPEAQLAELGAITASHYTDNPSANYVWDVKIWGDMVYRGAGDYDKNSGNTPIWAFNKATNEWVVTGTAKDEAIQRFIEINGTLYTPGIDSTGSWELGNFYVLEDTSWKQVQNLPNAVHNFDMMEFDGKIFAGVGTETVGNTVAVSVDKGETWDFVPLYRDDEILDTTGYEFSRTYAFAEYDNHLYALLLFKKLETTGYDYFIFRYEDGKMVYQAVADGSLTGHASRNYWQGRLEWNGVCYLATTQLNAITNFADPESYQQIAMPDGEYVTDILLYNNELYVLSFLFTDDSTYHVTIYKSATGEEGSFTAVTTFDYAAVPLCFDFDGTHFYIGTGTSPTDPATVGMLLRVKA